MAKSIEKNKKGSGVKVVKKKRLLDIMRIRKSNTKNDLWESPAGRAFIDRARSMVKESCIDNNKHFFILYEILDD